MTHTKENAKWFVAWLVIIFLAIVQSGCANTCKGFSKLVQGAGQVVTGAGLDIEEAVDNQSK